MSFVALISSPKLINILGIGSRFIEHVKKTYAGCVIRLEVEEENERAVKVYEKNGFHVLPYMEMITNE